MITPSKGKMVEIVKFEIEKIYWSQVMYLTLTVVIAIFILRYIWKLIRAYQQKKSSSGLTR